MLHNGHSESGHISAKKQNSRIKGPYYSITNQYRAKYYNELKKNVIKMTKRRNVGWENQLF